MSAAITYSKALLEAAKDAGKGSVDLDRFDTELIAAVEWSETHGQLRSAISGTAVKLSEKAKIVEELSKKSGFDPFLARFLVLLAKKGRFSELSDVLKAFRLQRLEAEGGVLGQVLSADTFGEEDLKSLVQAFEKKTGKKVRFEVSVDAKLLAGFKVTLQGKTYDGTLRSQLDRAKAMLTSRS